MFVFHIPLWSDCHTDASQLGVLLHMAYLSCLTQSSLSSKLFTPHAHARAGGYVIGAGVHICIYIGIYVCGQKKIESYFSDRLALSNIHCRTSRRMYRLDLPLPSTETLSSSSKSRIFLYNAHLALFVQMDDTIAHSNASVSRVVALAWRNAVQLITK